MSRSTSFALAAAVGMSACLPQTTLAGDPCALGSATTLAVTNNGFSDYDINGANDPTLTVVRGCTYTFNVNASGHPFWIKSVQGNGTGNSYNDGVSGNGDDVGTISWTVPLGAPDTLFYNCQFHAAMTGTIEVIDGVDPLIFFDGFEF